MRTWTPEARQAQAEAIRRWQPWNNSTGPQTVTGKSRTRLNAQKHGNYNAETRARNRELKSLLIRQREFLKSIRLMLKLRKNLKTVEQTIINDVLLAQGRTISQELEYWCISSPFVIASRRRSNPAYYPQNMDCFDGLAASQ